MKKGLKRSLFRLYVKAQKTLFASTAVSFILIVAIGAAITFKSIRHFKNREPANHPRIYDNYQPNSRMMIPEYMDSLKSDN